MSRIIVKNLPKVVSEQKLQSLFAQKGTITDIQLKYKDGKFRQFAFIGYLEEKSGQEAKDFFNNTFIGTNKVIVELCAVLGDESKPQSWSKHAKDSETSKKKEKNKLFEKHDPAVVVHEEKPKSTSDKIDELLSNYKEDPQFQEFMRAHAKDKLEWENDFGILNNKKTLLLEMTPENDTSSKLANLEISDQDYMKHMKGESSLKEPESNKNPLQLFTVKIRNIPKKMKRDDLKKFFRPSKAHSVRLPKNQAFACAYVGFKLERDMKRALLKDKSFLKGKQVHVYEFNSKSNEEEGSSNKKHSLNSRWQEQEDKLKSEENIGDSGKLFFRNLSYTSVTEDDIQKLFEKYGSIVDINVPIDATTRKMKGFGTVSFLMPQNAYTAYNELNGTMFHGRMFHILPGKSCDKTTVEQEDPKNYKDKKLKDMKKTASTAVHNWNSLFINANAVGDAIAKSFGKSKEDVLDVTGGSGAAVRLALGESQLVLEMKSFLESHGVRLDAFEGDPKKRSKTIILVKNIPSGTLVEELQSKFAAFGLLEKIVLPPSGVTCLVKFSDPSEARNAFKKLAYTKFKHVPLLLEWAPENTFRNNEELKDNKCLISIAQNEKKEDEEELPPESNSTLFIKNLNFQTSEEKLRTIFNSIGTIHSVQIAKKKDNDGKLIQLGYGFIQFKLNSDADKALKNLQHKEIDGHKIELKRSDRTTNLPIELLRKSTNNTEQRESTKIMVRNIPFQANVAEIRLLFQTFGEIRAIRLPKKTMPGTEQQHRGFGFVDFVNKSDAKNAFNALHYSTHLYGRRLVLEWASSEENVGEIRKRTAQHSNNTDEDIIKKPRKGWLKDELFMNPSNESEEIN